MDSSARGADEPDREHGSWPACASAASIGPPRRRSCAASHVRCALRLPSRTRLVRADRLRVGLPQVPSSGRPSLAACSTRSRWALQPATLVKDASATAVACCRSTSRGSPALRASRHRPNSAAERGRLGLRLGGGLHRETAGSSPPSALGAVRERRRIFGARRSAPRGSRGAGPSSARSRARSVRAHRRRGAVAGVGARARAGARARTPRAGDFPLPGDEPSRRRSPTIDQRCHHERPSDGHLRPQLAARASLRRRLRDGPTAATCALRVTRSSAAPRHRTGFCS